MTQLCYGTPRHEMVEVVRGLVLCECSVTGSLAHLKGIVADARALIDREGGLEAVRNRIAREHRAALKARKEERAELMKHWHEFGTYQ